jgi:putative spermidine/putrescine transport system substrate-binding protein
MRRAYYRAWILAYNRVKTRVLERARPTTIADMFDTKKLPGNARPRSALGGLPEGADADACRPTRFRVLGHRGGQRSASREARSDDIVFYTSNAQPIQLLSSGAVAIAQSSNGRIQAAIMNDKKRFVAVWDAQVYYPDVWFIPKGGNKALAIKFLQFITQPKIMAALTNYIPYAPVRISAQQYVSEPMKPYLTTSHDLAKGTLSNMPSGPTGMNSTSAQTVTAEVAVNFRAVSRSTTANPSR